MATLVHPYSQLTGGKWLKGNLHTHTTQSDGAATPQTVIDDYAGRGHGFLMLSDHDVFTSEATYRQWDNRGMVLIPGNELAGGPHLLHVDADRYVASRPSRQEIINEILAAEKETGRGFVIVNHPNWQEKFDHATIEQMREWTGYLGMEIYNGVICVLDGSPYATNKWDMLLSEGRRLWGFANDDSHRPSTVGFGWNVAYVREPSVAGVVEALRNGRFYPSTGVEITGIEVEGMKIRLTTKNARRICALRNVGKRFAVVDSNTIEVEAPEDAKYVRFECWGDGEQFAWTQPFYVAPDGQTATAAHPYIRDWQVTALLEHGTLADANLADAEKLPKQPLTATATGAIAGMVDVRQQIGGNPGILYLTTEITRDQAGPGVLRLGYDGPLRVWLNGEQIFHGPGTNPAIADQLGLTVNFHAGANKLVIAFDANYGKAWGIFARVAKR